MKFGNYEIEHSAYIESLVEPDEGQSKEDALVEILSYHADAVLKQHELEKATAFTLTRFLNRPIPEFGIFVDPEGKKMYFGTEAEVQTRLENR